MTHEEKIEALKAMLAEGRFHHATYRNIGTLWEGLYIYENAPERAMGFQVALHFSGREDLEPGCKAREREAHELVRHTGVSVGSRGNG
jgi:hypothetical protein